MEVSRNWRLQSQRYRMEGLRCEQCSTVVFPARAHCPQCAGESFAVIGLRGLGEVYSFTQVHDAPTGFENDAPFFLALVRLDEGPLVTAQLTDVERDTVYIGMPVEMVTRKLREDGERGMLVYGYKFRPLLRQRRPDEAVALPARVRVPAAEVVAA
jgi:uncharacterized OB-fold protein